MAKRTGGKPSGANRGDAYVPDVGDLVWLSFSPQAGREQGGRRPALVLSARAYNEKAGQCLVCPVTSQAKGYPFEAALPEGLAVGGVVLADHIKSADWHARNVAFAGKAPNEVLAEVRGKLRPLLGT